jgi:pimeloyl-ACP methyl ester carboxylesterase
VWRRWLDTLARRHTLVRYDERGCGLSDRDVELSLDAFVGDLEALVDTLGLERFPLLGMSQGASTSLAYAVRHPERVTHLILIGSRIEPVSEDVANAMLEMIRIGWGRDNEAFRQAFTTLLMPDATQEQMRSFNEMQRTSATAEQAALLARAIFRIDTRPLGPLVRVPTLVVHSRGDAVMPFDAARRLAASIPGARFLPLESDNHVLIETDPAWPRFVAELERFLAPAVEAAPTDARTSVWSAQRPEARVDPVAKADRNVIRALDEDDV